MVNTFEDWINRLVESDEICTEYYKKVKKSLSVKQLFDSGCDTNGIEYLCIMDAKGMPLPYEIVTSKFGSFINGRYISEHKASNGDSYKSSIYCCYQGEIKADVTILGLLGCKADVYVGENNVVTIYADKNCDLNIACPLGSIARVHYWGKEPEYSGNVELIKRE